MTGPLALAVLAGAAAPGLATPREPIELRLLRTIYTGTLAQVEAAAAAAHARDSRVSFSGHVLARSALVAVSRDEGFPEWPLERVLDRVLELLSGPSHAFASPPGLPEGLEGPQLAFAAVHALVTTGQAAKAEDVLERHLGSGARFKKAVALQALRNIGDARSSALLQRFVEAGDDQNLAENLLADQRFPFWHDLASRLTLVPPERRGREELLAVAGEGCGERQALAVYFLGYLAPAADPAQEERERERLRELSRAPCFWTRYFAVRALALRSPQTIDFWTGLFRGESDAWQRAQLARVGFARFGRVFLRTALALLKDEPSQYVQWELMHGNIEIREGARFRTYWDIWEPVTLQFYLNFPRSGGPMGSPDIDELLDWLETGARPRDEWVRNHLFYGIAGHLRGEATRRLLRLFDALADKTRHFWVLSPLKDPGALPLLRYWLTLPITVDAQRQSLQDLVEGLESYRADLGAARAACCLPTSKCLLAWLRAGTPAAAVANAEEARRWLEAIGPRRPEPHLRFLDPLERVAVARWPDGREERWEHLYGCWRRIGGRPREAGAALSLTAGAAPSSLRPR